MEPNAKTDGEIRHFGNNFDAKRPSSRFLVTKFHSYIECMKFFNFIPMFKRITQSPLVLSTDLKSRLLFPLNEFVLSLRKTCNHAAKKLKKTYSKICIRLILSDTHYYKY